MKAVLVHCTISTSAAATARLKVKFCKASRSLTTTEITMYLCFLTRRCYSPLSHTVSHQHYHITSIWHYHNVCQHEIHWDYEKAVNAPIKKVGPSGRANTCLVIALTSGLWERSCNAKQETKSLISFQGHSLRWSRLTYITYKARVLATNVQKVKTTLTLLPFCPAMPGLPLWPWGPCEEKQGRH